MSDNDNRDWDIKVTFPESRKQFIRWNLYMIGILIAMCGTFIAINSRSFGCCFGPVGVFWFMMWNPHSATLWHSGKAVRANLALLGAYLAMRAVLIDLMLLPRRGTAIFNIVWPAEVLVALICFYLMVSMFRSELKRPWR